MQKGVETPPPSAVGLQLLLLNVQDKFADKKLLFLEAPRNVISARLGVHIFSPQFYEQFH